MTNIQKKPWVERDPNEPIHDIKTCEDYFEAKRIDAILWRADKYLHGFDDDIHQRSEGFEKLAHTIAKVQSRSAQEDYCTRIATKYKLQPAIFKAMITTAFAKQQTQVDKLPSDQTVIDFSNDLITSTESDPIIPVIKIRDSIFAVKGDISIIGGLPKAGKTSVCAYIIATALKEFNSDQDTLGIRSTFCEGKKVVYIDTEQPKPYTTNLLKTILKIIGSDRKTAPDNLIITNLRRDTSEVKRMKIDGMMNKYPDAHLWIIDGVADLIRDPNDTKESFQIIEHFMIQSDKLKTAIVLYIHENPGSTGKLRGNLGSEAERKCGGAITIKKIKEKGIHTIEPKVIRGSEDFDPVLAEYSKDKGYLVSVNESKAVEIRNTLDKSQVKLQKLINLMKRCTIAGSLKHKDLVQAILRNVIEIEATSISKKTAENRIRAAYDAGILIKSGELYRIADIYIPQP